MLDIEDKLILLAKEVSTLKKQTTSLSTATETITKLEGPQGIQGPKGEQGDRGADGVNGKDGVDGRDGKDGDKGADGVSVIDATVDFDNSLVLKLSDGSEIDAGQINVVVSDGITHITSRQVANGGDSSAVSSVNGFTGAVVLTASDVGAATTAQGTLASTALQPASIGVNVQGYNANTVIDSSYVHTDNNYTTTEKSKLSGIAAGAEVNVNADWTAVSGDSQILNKPSLATVATSGAYSDLSGLPTIPAQFNPSAGTNVTLSGTYPNITFSASGGGGGGGTAATATIDLGATPVSEASVTVTNASITSTSYIQVFVMVDSTADNTTEDHRHAAASWQMSALPNTGSFTLYINSMMDLCWGTFKIRYTLV